MSRGPSGRERTSTSSSRLRWRRESMQSSSSERIAGSSRSSSGWSTQHPYREHLLEQLMLALYRAGRQADALDAYRRGTARLRSELGLEPSRNLQALEQAILNHDPSLDAPRAARARRAALRRRFGWRLIAAGGAVLAAAAAAATALLVTGSGSGSGSGASYTSLKPGVVLLDMQTHRVIRQWPGRYFNYPWVFTGGGHFWMASFNKPGTEIDPRNRTLPPPVLSAARRGPGAPTWSHDVVHDPGRPHPIRPAHPAGEPGDCPLPDRPRPAPLRPGWDRVRRRLALGRKPRGERGRSSRPGDRLGPGADPRAPPIVARVRRRRPVDHQRHGRGRAD